MILGMKLGQNTAQKEKISPTANAPFGSNEAHLHSQMAWIGKNIRANLDG